MSCAYSLGSHPALSPLLTFVCSPYKFETPWHDFEFAYHVQAVEANLVIVSMAWLTGQDVRHFTRMPEEPDIETLTYWYAHYLCLAFARPSECAFTLQRLIFSKQGTAPRASNSH